MIILVLETSQIVQLKVYSYALAKNLGIQYQIPLKIDKKPNQVVKHIKAGFYNTQTQQFITNPLSQRQTSPKTRDVSPINTTELSDQQIQEMVVDLNKQAMLHLKQNQNEECHRLLKNAERILKEKNPSKMVKSDHEWQGSYFILQSMTQNNLGCYYKKMNSPQVALHYMKKAQRNENILSTSDISRATTELNICAVLSKLNKHNEAIQHAQYGIKILRQQIKEYQFKHKKASTDIGQIQEEPEQEINDSLQASKADFQENDIHIQSNPSTKKQDFLKNMYQTLIVAYHNLGVEFEYLKDYKGALEAYKNAIEYSESLEQQVPIAETIKNTVKEIEMKMQMQEEKFHLRDSKRQISVFKHVSAANSRHGSNQRSIKNETAANFYLKYPSALQDLPWSSMKNSFMKNTPQQVIDSNSNLQKRSLIKRRLMDNQEYQLKQTYMLDNTNLDHRINHQFNNTFAIKPRQLEENQNQKIENSEMVLAFSSKQDPNTQNPPQFTSYYSRRSNERLSDMQLVQYRVKPNRYSSVRRPQKLEKIAPRLSPKREGINAYDKNLKKFYVNQRIYQSKDTERNNIGPMSPDSTGEDTEQFTFFQETGSNMNFNSSLLSQRYTHGFAQQDPSNKVSTPDSGKQRNKFYKTQMQQREKSGDRVTHSSNAQARNRFINLQDPVSGQYQSSNNQIQFKKSQIESPTSTQNKKSKAKKKIEQDKLNAWQQQQQFNDRASTLQDKVEYQLSENRQKEESQELKLIQNQEETQSKQEEGEKADSVKPIEVQDSQTLFQKIEKVPLKQSNTQYDIEQQQVRSQTVMKQEVFNNMHLNLVNDIKLPKDINILSAHENFSQQLSLKTYNTNIQKNSLQIQQDRSFEVKSSAMTVKRNCEGGLHHEQSYQDKDDQSGDVLLTRQSIETFRRDHIKF